MLDRGWHSGSVFGTHSAAMASGKLRGLSPAQLEDALGLAGTQSSGLMAAQYEAMSKRMHHGLAARNGFYAAGLAAHGYTGIKRVFEREYGGFLSVFGEGHNPDADAAHRRARRAMGNLDDHGEVLRRDGRTARRDRRRPPPAPIALTRNASRTSTSPSAPRSTNTDGGPRERPLTPIGAQMHLGYTTAAALLDGNVLPEQFTPPRLDADDIWRLVERTDVHLDEARDRAADHRALRHRPGRHHR